MARDVSLVDVLGENEFAARHIGVSAADLPHMLEAIGAASLDALIAETVPQSIRQRDPLDLGAALSEREALQKLRAIARKNKVLISMIGQGYYGTITPAVIARNILENPAWYTAYTPYQSEISQGRLEALLNFQTMIADLTGLEIANASLLDEATAAAEAMAMARRVARSQAQAFFVDRDCHPQTLAVVAHPRRAAGLAHRDGRSVDRARCERGVRSAVAVSRMLRRHPGLPAGDRGSAFRRRACRHGGRSPGAHADYSARRARRRYRRRLHPALRRAHGLWRAACGLHRNEVGTSARAPRPAGRGVGGQPRAPCLSARPANPRAAHPAGEGDIEHLYRPGAARDHGLHVRGLSRAGGTEENCAPRAPERGGAGRGTEGAGLDGRAATFL